NNNYLNRIKFESGFANKKSIYSDKIFPGDFDINYSIDHSNTNSDQTRKTVFRSIPSPTQNKLYDRHYDRVGNSTKQNIFISLGDFSKWIFDYKNRIMSGINIKLQNYLNMTTHNENNVVRDIDTLIGAYLVNEYLSGNNRFTIINEMPTLNLSKNVTKNFGTHYQKSLLINFNIQKQFYSLRNSSNHTFQNTAYNYSKFTPNAGVSYSNYQYGEYQDIYNLQFKVSSDYPTAGQLVPLVDSSDLYYIQQGNVYLKPTNRNELTFSWQHTSFRMKNIFNYNINVSTGIVKNGFADSSITDSLGRSSYYIVNADGGKYLSISGSLNKAIKFDKNNQLQIAFSPSFNFKRAPNSINKVWNISNSSDFFIFLNLSYSYKDRIALNLKQIYSYYHSKQTGILSSDLSNSLQATTLSMSINFTKKINCSSNITYNNSISTASKANSFTIWNANASYRFLSSNNLEVKMAALDLFRQNTGIINSGSNNTLTNGSVNVLHQYFMLTLSYFPRIFGKRND
ncbi:MAG: hypothetical protein Q8R50_14930, partial [Sediminibacterium sp.]|nr:hypothetical protein [Sediminibacterium sp.]